MEKELTCEVAGCGDASVTILPAVPYGKGDTLAELADVSLWQTCHEHEELVCNLFAEAVQRAVALDFLNGVPTDPEALGAVCQQMEGMRTERAQSLYARLCS